MKSVICFLSIFVCTSVFATEKQVVPLHKDDPAPFTGVLMDPKTAAKIVADKEFEDSKCELLIQDEKTKQERKCVFEKGSLKLSLDSEVEQNKILVSLQEKEIVRLNELLKKEPPVMGPLWFVSGAVAGIILSVSIFYAAVQIRNEPEQN